MTTATLLPACPCPEHPASVLQPLPGGGARGTCPVDGRTHQMYPPGGDPVKLPVIPLPDPVYVITVPGAGRLHRAEAAVLRFAVLALPPAAASLVLGPSWAVALIVFAVMVLTVGVENSGAEEKP